jgi:hypothetical protein
MQGKTISIHGGTVKVCPTCHGGSLAAVAKAAELAEQLDRVTRERDEARLQAAQLRLLAGPKGYYTA